MPLSEPLVSVLIPIYRVEKYIEKCARSIFEQTYNNLEIIFINDCSTDNSVSILNTILKDYPNRKLQTKIINHKINKGLAAARRTGLLAASGYYIQNYDSDDYVDADMIRQMVSTAQKDDADITICDFLYVYNNSQKHIHVNPSLTTNRLLKQIISGEVHSSVCNKLIKRELYVDNNIYPIDGLDMNEDLSVMFRLVYYAKSVAYISQPLYCYVLGRQGAYTSQKMSLSQQKDIVALISLIDNFFYTKKISPDICDAIKIFKARILCEIALYGDINYYKIFKNNFSDVTKYYIIKNKRIIPIVKLSGLLLLYHHNILLSILRCNYRIYSKYKRSR